MQWTAAFVQPDVTNNNIVLATSGFAFKIATTIGRNLSSIIPSKLCHKPAPPTDTVQGQKYRGLATHVFCKSSIGKQHYTKLGGCAATRRAWPPGLNVEPRRRHKQSFQKKWRQIGDQSIKSLHWLLRIRTLTNTRLNPLRKLVWSVPKISGHKFGQIENFPKRFPCIDDEALYNIKFTNVASLRRSQLLLWQRPPTW